MIRSHLRAGLVAAGLAIAALFLVKAYVAEIYLVDSSSMEPTLRAGERVLVRYTDQPPERFDLVVVRFAGERDPRVKRAAGLPGEHVQISAGDLRIDGKRLPPAAGRPELLEVYDSARTPFEEAFTGAGWIDGELDGRSARAEACFRGRITDALPGQPEASGLRQVGDALLEAELELLQAREGAAWVLALTEQGDLFEARAELGAEGVLTVRLLREHGGEREELAAGILLLGEARRVRARFSNLDNLLELRALALDGGGAQELVVQAGYEANAAVGGPDPTAPHRQPRACLAVEGGLLRVGRLRLLRDVHYTEAGQWGTTTPLHLGPGELFVLGDHSAASEDSRNWGAVPMEALIGRPVAVVWPPRAWRRLGGGR